jgi:hypothetical protein
MAGNTEKQSSMQFFGEQFWAWSFGVRKKLPSRLKLTKVDFKSTQVDLKLTKVDFKSTQVDLKLTKSQLKVISWAHQYSELWAIAIRYTELGVLVYSTHETA